MRAQLHIKISKEVTQLYALEPNTERCVTSAENCTFIVICADLKFHLAPTWYKIIIVLHYYSSAAHIVGSM